MTKADRVHVVWIFIFLLVQGAFAGSPVWAKCVKGDISGTWNFYFTSPLRSEYCTVRVDSRGVVDNGTSCRDNFGNRDIVDGGRLSVASDCQVSGRITIDNGFDLVDAVINRASMDRSKDSIAGVGEDSFDQFGFFGFTAIKK